LSQGICALWNILKLSEYSLTPSIGTRGVYENCGMGLGQVYNVENSRWRQIAKIKKGGYYKLEPKLHMNILMGNWHSKDTSQLKLVVSSFPYFMISKQTTSKWQKFLSIPRGNFNNFFNFAKLWIVRRHKTYEEKGFSKVDEKQTKLWQKLA